MIESYKLVLGASQYLVFYLIDGSIALRSHMVTHFCSILVALGKEGKGRHTARATVPRAVTVPAIEEPEPEPAVVP